MSEPHRIRLEDLRRAVDQVLRAVESTCGTEVELSGDEALSDPHLAWHNLSHLIGLLRATEAKLRP